MDRIEFNVQTGERKVIPLTQEEIDAAAARKAEEDAKPPPPSQAMHIVDALKADPEAIAELKKALG